MTLTSLIIFVINDKIDYVMGLTMLLGIIIGSYLGVRTAIKKGNKFIKYIFLGIILISGVKLLFF